MFQRLHKILRRHTSLSQIRHALITRIGDENTFSSESANRSVRKGSIPSEYLHVVSDLPLSPARTFDSAKVIASDLAQRKVLGDGLSCDSVTALRLVYSGQGGICSDVSQVFTGLCIAAGIQVREWGVCDDFAGKRGHTFNEIFSSEHNKWVFLDAHKSLYAKTRGCESPLSVAELINLVTAGEHEKIEMIYIGRIENQHECTSNVAMYYFNPKNVFFLIVNNNVFGQDLFLGWADRVPLAVLHALMLVLRIYPRFAVYTNEDTRQELAGRLHAHKRDLVGMLGRLARALVRA